MNAYFLVEGRRTEAKLYPSWLETLLPNHARVRNAAEADTNNYYLISGMGYPSLLTHLKHAIADCNALQKYQFLILCLDGDEFSVGDRQAEVTRFLESDRLSLLSGAFRVVVQYRTIETWLLGNPRIVTHHPSQQDLSAFLKFYNVRTDDPEAMPLMDGYKLHASFHEAYLKAIFREKGIHYTKSNPGDAAKSYYLSQLINRTSKEPRHLKSFQFLLQVCREIQGE